MRTRRLTTLLVLVPLVGCDLAPEQAKDLVVDSAATLIECFTDLDGDGYGAGLPNHLELCPPGTREAEGDCDESDFLVHPGAVERCDGVDNDCDGRVDIGAVDAILSYRDTDGDGFGGPDEQWSCEVPTGSVETGGDCDDDEATVWPGAPESCDGVDEDCDGAADNAPVDGLPVWPDQDGDGFGDETLADTACALPSGWVSRGRDCDDTDAAIHAGAAESDCSDPVDYNCDGSVGAVDLDGDGFVACRECDDGEAAIFPGASEVCNGEDDDCDGVTDPPRSEGASLWFEDADGDGWGVGDSAQRACAAAPGWAEQEGDCDESDPLVNPGMTELCEDGLDNDCDGTSNGCGAWGREGLGAADIRLYGGGPADLGFGVESAGDFDALGGVDIMISTAAEGTNGAHSGAVYVLSLSNGLQPSLGNASAVFVGEGPWELAGTDLAALGDCGGDGLDDIAVSAVWSGRGGYASGAVYIVYGPRAGRHDLGTADAILVGEAGSQAGWSLSGGEDVTGDGIADLLVGAPRYAPTPARDDGIAYLLPCSVSGIFELADSTTRFIAEGEGHYLGSAVAQVGDLDGDGRDDIAIGAPLASPNGQYSGAVYFVLSPTAGDMSVADADMRIVGARALSSIGHAIEPAGDIDGDGYVDVLIGAAGDATYNTSNGAVHLILGPPEDGTDMSAAFGTWYGGGAYDSAGSAVAAGSDLNGDSWLDFAVGAPYTGGASTSPGSVYVLYGPFQGGSNMLEDADAIIEGEAMDDQAGSSLAMPGDLNGDGHGDLLIGAPEHQMSGVETGAAYVVFGGNP